MGEVVIPAVRLAPRGDEGRPLGARGGGVAGQRGPRLEPDQPGHRTPQVRRVSSAKARAAVTTSATGTFSSGPCARLQVARARSAASAPRRPRTAAGRCRRRSPAPAACRRRRRRRPSRTAGSSGWPAGSWPLANAPPVQVSRTGCSASHGCPAQISASRSSNAARAVGDRLAQADAVPALGDQPVGHRAGPVAGLHPPDRQPVGEPGLPEARVGVLLPLGLELPQPGVHVGEQLDGADARGRAWRRARRARSPPAGRSARRRSR